MTKIGHSLFLDALIKRVKLILLKPYLLAKSNGGEISMIERLRLFQSWGWEIKVKIALPEFARESSAKFLEEMKTPLKADSYEVGGLKCDLKFSADFHPHELKNQSAMETYFADVLAEEKPELVWAHYTDFFAVTSAMKWNSSKSWVILTDNEYPRQVQLNQFPSIGESYLKIKTIIVASRFMQKSVRASLPWAKTVFIPNPVEAFAENPVSRSSNFWVFVNPTQVKGVDFMIELAEKMPDQSFLFVGNWATENPPHLPKNISSLPRQNGLKDVFSKAKGLLMPSVWDEAFGRLVLEAMAAGIPVIASNRGALPETVGTGGLSIPLDVNLWNKTLRNGAPYWIEQIARGFDRVKTYRAETEKRFKALKRLVNAEKKA
jgi:glycosyltransferase involved in cell wall biosynthesis